MKRGFFFLRLILCTACCHVNAAPENQKAESQITKNGSSPVEFRLIDRNKVTFQITNHSKRPVTLDSLYPKNSGYSYEPVYGTYQYLSHKQWVTLEASGDTLVYPYSLRPGERVVWHEFHFDERLKRLKKGTPVRQRVGDFLSQPFRW